MMYDNLALLSAVLLFSCSAAEENASVKTPEKCVKYTQQDFKTEHVFDTQFENDKIILYDDSNAIRLCFVPDSSCITIGWFRFQNDSIVFYHPGGYNVNWGEINTKYLTGGHIKMSTDSIFQKFFGHKLNTEVGTGWIFDKETLRGTFKDEKNILLIYPEVDSTGYYKNMKKRF